MRVIQIMSLLLAVSAGTSSLRAAEFKGKAIDEAGRVLAQRRFAIVLQVRADENLRPRTLNLPTRVITTDAQGEFTLDIPDQLIRPGEVELIVNLDGSAGRVQLLSTVENLFSGGEHTVELILRQSVLAFAQAGAPDGVIAVFNSGTAEFHLLPDVGTALYQPAGRGYQLQRLERAGGNDNFIFYKEVDSLARYWAFGKRRKTVCRIVCGRAVVVRGGHPIWMWSKRGGDKGKWRFFGYGRQRLPVREIANPETVRQRAAPAE